MGNFHNEFSEQILLFADPVTNLFSPYCTSVFLCLFPTLEAVLWWFAPLFLLLCGNTAVGQLDFHFPFQLHLCATDVLGHIHQGMNKVALKEAVVVFGSMFSVSTSALALCWLMQWPVPRQARGLVQHCQVPSHGLEGAASLGKQAPALLCSLLKKKSACEIPPAQLDLICCDLYVGG